MAKQILIGYDKEADVAYISFDNPVEGYGEEIDEGVFARYHSESNDLIGITIINFSKKFDKHPKDIGVALKH